MRNATEIRLDVEGKKQGQKIFFHFAFIACVFLMGKEGGLLFKFLSNYLLSMKENQTHKLVST